MEFKIFNKKLNYLLGYLVFLFLFLGIFGNDLVGDMAKFVLLYGIPLLVFIVLYLATIAFEVHNKLKNKTKLNLVNMGVVSIKLCIATAPMFYLDNSFALLLSALRI